MLKNLTILTILVCFICIPVISANACCSDNCKGDGYYTDYDSFRDVVKSWNEYNSTKKHNRSNYSVKKSFKNFDEYRKLHNEKRNAYITGLGSNNYRTSCASKCADKKMECKSTKKCATKSCCSDKKMKKSCHKKFKKYGKSCASKCADKKMECKSTKKCATKSCCSNKKMKKSCHKKFKKYRKSCASKCADKKMECKTAKKCTTKSCSKMKKSCKPECKKSCCGTKNWKMDKK